MRWIALLLLVATLAGCKSTVGPLQSRQRDQNPDPLLNSEQKKSFVRDRYPYPDDNKNLLPNTYNDRPSPAGR